SLASFTSIRAMNGSPVRLQSYQGPFVESPRARSLSSSTVGKATPIRYVLPRESNNLFAHRCAPVAPEQSHSSDCLLAPGLDLSHHKRLHALQCTISDITLDICRPISYV